VGLHRQVIEGLRTLYLGVAGVTAVVTYQDQPAATPPFAVLHPGGRVIAPQSGTLEYNTFSVPVHLCYRAAPIAEEVSQAIIDLGDAVLAHSRQHVNVCGGETSQTLDRYDVGWARYEQQRYYALLLVHMVTAPLGVDYEAG
jgi:hypothetical protein